MVQQRRPRVPRHPLGAVDDVVAAQRRDRDVQAVGDAELLEERRELGDDLVEALLGVVDEVHLVDRDDEVGDPEQRADEGVALGLLEHAAARVEQDHREVGGRRAGDHVAGVLLVARAVGDDEAPPRGREVAVGDVDRDALLALGAQAVGQQREVDLAVATLARDLGDMLELVLEDLLGVKQQAADQRALAVVDRTRGREAQQIERHRRRRSGELGVGGHLRSIRLFCGLPWRLLRFCRRRGFRRVR